MAPARNLRFELQVEGFAPEDLEVVRFSGEERLFETYRLSVEAVARAVIDPEALLGKRASLRLYLAGEVARAFHGLVARTAVTLPRPDAAQLTVEIVPRLALLELGRSSHVYQGVTVPEVVKKVLARRGVPESAQSWQTKGSYARREYVIQDGESDLAFVLRLLREEGIGFALRNAADEDAEKVAFFDDSGALPPVPGDAQLLDRDATGLRADTVTDLHERRSGASDAVMLRDYDYKHPALDLTSSTKEKGSTGREVYLHPGNFLGPADGKRLAGLTLESLRCGAVVVAGESDCVRLEPGRTARLEGHRRAALEDEYLLVSVRHEGHLVEGSDAPAYRGLLTAIPRAVRWRPPLAVDPPCPSPEVAFVTCPGGEEIHADEWGRVKVRFPWDRSGKRDDTASCWLRVGQVPLGGSMILPRGEFEVVVDHEAGDPDRPFVSGHLYNAERAPPYALPEGKTRSSIQSATTAGGPGANELRFEDHAGSEEIFLNASKDYTVSVEDDASTSVAHVRQEKVGSNRKLRVGAERVAEVGGARTVSVGATQDVTVEKDLTEIVGGSESTTVGGMRKVKVGGDHEESCAGNLTRAVGALQSVTALRGYQRKVLGSSSIQVGGAWIEAVGRNRTAMVQGPRTETVGAAKLTKAKAASVSCGAAYVSNAGADSSQCGEARSETAKGPLALTAGGGLSVKANDISIEAKDSLTLVAGACSFKLSSSGKIEIKAPKVNLKGVKKLGQGQHKSN